MIEKLENIKNRFEEISALLTQQEIVTDIKRATELNKEYKDLSKIMDEYSVYKGLLDQMEQAKHILETEKEEELRELAKEEIDILTVKISERESLLRNLLIPKDPNDRKNAILEIRAGVGGDEAALFAGVLFRMYQRFCEAKKWKITLVDCTEGPSGGFKEVISTVSGENVYGKLKYESGVHRVQRVPVTEAQGRVHTSAASVVILPEAEEFDVKIDMNDIRKDTFCSSGPGGQSVNTTYSAIRLTHIPTGMIVQCQDEKSQHRNFEKALTVLRSRLYELELEKINSELGAQRKSMVKSGDRSDKIRTYNYPQSRVTDHRIGLTLYNLPAILDGDLKEINEALQIAETAEKLKEEIVR